MRIGLDTFLESRSFRIDSNERLHVSYELQLGMPWFCSVGEKLSIVRDFQMKPFKGDFGS